MIRCVGDAVRQVRVPSCDHVEPKRRHNAADVGDEPSGHPVDVDAWNVGRAHALSNLTVYVLRYRALHGH